MADAAEIFSLFEKTLELFASVVESTAESGDEMLLPSSWLQQLLILL